MSEDLAPPRLILASTSKYRAQLLGRLGVRFEQIASDFDERALDASFDTIAAAHGERHFAEMLARGKAEAVARSRPDVAILAADQIALIDEGGPRLLHKPATHDDAVDQLMRLAGRVHRLITAVVLKVPRREVLVGYDEHHMCMRSFDRREAQAYVDRRAPLDSVGAYHIEDEGIALFESIDGHDFTGIIGLPLLTVAPMLRQSGLL